AMNPHNRPRNGMHTETRFHLADGRSALTSLVVISSPKAQSLTWDNAKTRSRFHQSFCHFHHKKPPDREHGRRMPARYFASRLFVIESALDLCAALVILCRAK